MRRNAAIYLPAPPRTGRRGRPRTKGDQLPAPAELTANTPRRQWRAVTIDVRSRQVERLAHVRDVLWYTVNHRDLVRLVIIRHPDRTCPDDTFFTTDLTATAADVASRYAGRWSIEVTFRDTKQDLGGHRPQCWKRHGPERATALSLWLHSLVWCWYLDRPPADRAWTAKPWNPHKTAPTFLDALAALRRTLWNQRITTMSSPGHDNTKIVDALLDTLSYAA
jgi:hypothetical protein